MLREVVGVGVMVCGLGCGAKDEKPARNIAIPLQPIQHPRTWAPIAAMAYQGGTLIEVSVADVIGTPTRHTAD